MGFLLRSARKDALRLLRDPAGLVLWICIPVVLGGLITLAMGGTGGGETAPKARVLVADREGGFLGGLLAGALANAGGTFAVEQVEEAAGRAALDRGEASALVVLPENFTSAVLEEAPATIEVVQNPSQRILPRIVTETLSVLPDLVFYLHRVLGDDLRELAAGPPEGNVFPDERIAAFSVRINGLVERLQGSLVPPLIDVDVVVEREDEGDAPPAGLALLFLPGILIMSLIFLGQGLSEDLWRERDLFTLRRAVVAPPSTAAFLGGKLLAGAGLTVVVSAVFLGAGCLVLEVPLARWPAGVLWGGLTGTVLLAAMYGLQLVASSQRGGNVLTMMIVFPLMMVGGSFFPFEAMPEWMAAVGRLTPNGWALEHLKSVLLGRADLASLALPAAAMTAAGAAAFAFATWRLVARAGGS